MAHFDRSSILTRFPSRWCLDPGYMHSFGLTENFFVLIEQPLTINVPALVSGTVRRRPMIEAMRWHQGKANIFHVVNRITGERTE